MKNSLATSVFIFLVYVGGLTASFGQKSQTGMGTGSIQSQNQVKTLVAGQEAPSFNLKNVDERILSLAECSDRGAIVVFTCNHCPFSQLYEGRIIELHKKFAESGFPVVAINPNDSISEPQDAFSIMQKLASGRNFLFPYLLDDTQDVAKAYGATKTPHVFVLQNENGLMIVKYVGAIDDNPDDPSAVSQNFVSDAITDLLEGREVRNPASKAIGCNIKWKK